MFNRFTPIVVASLVSTLLLSGCGAWQAVSDGTSSAYRAVVFKQVKTLNIDLSARASLNRDDADRSTSVVVRIYQLADRKLFDVASYDDLLKNDKTVLAQALQASLATVVNPDASVSLSQPMQAGTRYIAIVVFYRVPGTDGEWRRVIERKALSADTPLKFDLVNSHILTSTGVSQK